MDSDRIERTEGGCFPGLCLHSGNHLFSSPTGSVDRERPLHYHQCLWGSRSAACPGGPLHGQWPGGHCLLPSDPRSSHNPGESTEVPIQPPSRGCCPSAEKAGRRGCCWQWLFGMAGLGWRCHRLPVGSLLFALEGKESAGRAE